MKRMKQTVALLLCVAALLALCACGGGAKKNVPVADLATAVSTALGKTDALAASDGMFLGMTQKSAADLGDHAVYINVYGANIDEFGIFKAGTMSAADLKAAVDDYLAKRVASWMEEYMPEEKPKLTGAEVRVNGDYVMYCILSDTDKTTAFKAFEDALK